MSRVSAGAAPKPSDSAVPAALPAAVRQEAAPPAPPPAPRAGDTKRWRAVFPLVLLSLLLGVAALGAVFAWLADDAFVSRQHAAIKDAVASRAGAEPSAAELAALEQRLRVDALRFENEPDDGRDVQSVLDAQGRILGWLSWDRRRPVADAVTALHGVPMMAAGLFMAFVGSALGGLYRARRAAKAALKVAHAAQTLDRATGLPNRHCMLECLRDAMETRGADEIVALLHVDIDGFNEIYEAVGIEGSDALLREVGSRLTAALPASAFVACIGEDDFGIVMKVAHVKAAVDVAALLVQATAKPFWIADQAIQVEANVGLAQSPRDADTPNEMMRRASLALRSAMRRGGGNVLGFDASLETECHDRRFLLKELRRALAEDMLQVHYQPIVAADGQHIVGVEALVRWEHPTRGNIPPATFIPIAEHNGLMIQLGEFVLRRALSDATRWNNTYVAVNLSPVQMRHKGLVGTVATIIAETGIDSSRVVLEITEGVLIDNPEEAKERLEQLRALGASIALDDFGSGYSSLSYLRRFPIDKLKIDKEFVAPLGNSSNGGVIIQAIVALGRSLGLSVLAEGVETEEQRILLRLAGCDEMQGFLFAKPAPRHVIDGLAKSAEAQLAEPADEPRVAGSAEG